MKEWQNSLKDSGMEDFGGKAAIVTGASRGIGAAAARAFAAQGADTSRTVRIADNDRVRASIGATYSWNAHTTLDFAYTHIFVKDGGIDQSSSSGLTLQADVDLSVDILSGSVKFKW